MKTHLTLFLAVLARISVANAEPVTLLDGKLQLDTGEAFVLEKNKDAAKQEIAHFAAREGDAWGAITRGTHGLQPDGLPAYLKKKVAEYTRGLSWLPQLKWLKKEIVTIDGRQWADLRYIAPRAHAANPRDGLLYTRIFATSYEGQLLEILFTSNTDENSATKDQIDKIIESVRLENPK
ncbi:MAG TPA: hypothetical protein VJS88_04135 [Chthoniobacterales bacterium]|nr:hypothetical protein [Chthoniobacterales bacterium]